MKSKPDRQLINLVTLGCSKNLVDSEKLLKQFDANGLQVLHNDDSNRAQTVIINTCGFIKDAKQESIDTILQFARAKKQGNLQHLFVMGCLSERYKSALEKEIPEVDRYFGANNLFDIVSSLGYNYKENLLGERILSTPSHYAYLKISEGCDRHCSFCAIPLMRGKHKSRPIPDLLAEAQNLVRMGVKELILIAQDLSYYGIDLYRKQKLPELLFELSNIKELHWIRLHYAYPSGFPIEILPIINERENICNYLDIPFQHISNEVLKKMRRGITQQQTYDLIDTLRKSIQNLTLRTTLMVGHPGEGDQEFEELMTFIERVRFDRLGVFTYSEEEDTYGARNFKDSVSEKIKKQRADQIMKLQSEISRDLNQRKMGIHLNVIIDRKEGDSYIGRTEADSPEVDNEVIIKSSKDLAIGEFYLAIIAGAEDYDLYAEV